MSKRKQYILLSITVILLLLLGIGYYMYNKPPVDIQNEVGKKVTATALYECFTKDSALAKKDFTNKILQVSGLVTQVSSNQQNNIVVLLRTNIDGASVNCTMEGPGQNIATGNTVEIKGICNGIGEEDPDLGIMGDVYLIRCHTAK